MDKIILSPIELSELLSGLRAVVKEELQSQQKDQQLEKMLSPAETCNLFQPKITKPTLTAWTREGRLTEHRIGSRIFYRYSEVMEAVGKIKRYKKN